MPQMYPTQWMLLTNLMAMSLLMMMTTMSEIKCLETKNKQKMNSKKNWKW